MESMTTNDDGKTTDDEGKTAEEAAPSTLQQERDELQDRLLRTAAEFENYRKRTDRERRELHDFITADLMRDLLPIGDDLDRAIGASTAADSNPELAAFQQGVILIQRQWHEFLRKQGVEALEVVGQPFDPEWHEAVANEPASGRPDGEITAELRRGYRIGSKLLRAAMVRVAKA